MGYKMCDAAEVELVNGVFRPIRRALGLTAFGINQEEFPANADGYPDHDHSEDGQEEVFYVLEGSGNDGRRRRGRRAQAGPLHLGRGGVEAEDPSRRRWAQADRGGLAAGRVPATAGLASSASTSAIAASRRLRFAGSFSQPDAPDGCGSGIAATPSSSRRVADGVGQPPDAEQPSGRQARRP